MKKLARVLFGISGLAPAIAIAALVLCQCFPFQKYPTDRWLDQAQKPVVVVGRGNDLQGTMIIKLRSMDGKYFTTRDPTLRGYSKGDTLP